MKINASPTSIALALLACLTITQPSTTVHAQGTAFTYQGFLNSTNGPITGPYDLTFALFSTSSGGAAVAGPVTNTAVAVSNGLFSTSLDFGNQFPGSDRWLEIGVRPGGGGAFSTLSPRQALTPAPYAITSENLAGVIEFNTVAGLYSTVGGGYGNINVGYNATIGGGLDNVCSNSFATVGGGDFNFSTGNWATIAGGNLNISSTLYAMVGGGIGNVAGGVGSTVAGGSGNSSTGPTSAVGGGDGNIASGGNTAIAGGYFNIASGNAATVPGGSGNIASGTASFAAGHQAQAINDGSFVWSDYSGGSFASTAANQFAVSAAGGVLLAGDVALLGGAHPYHNLSLSGGNSTGFLYASYAAFGDGVHLGYNYYADSAGTSHVINAGGGTSRISTGYANISLFVAPVNLPPNTLRLSATTTGVAVYGTFNNSSDRNAKQSFEPVNASQILEKVLQMPVTQWSYKEDAATRHIGPMGQDFYQLFNIGTDDKHIAPIDEGGVAFAAIQGLNQKLETENAQLKQRLDALEKMLRNLQPK